MRKKEIPPSFIEENTRRYAAPQEEEPVDLESFVVFRLGEKWFAIETKFFLESFEEMYIHTIPFKSDEVLKGLVNVHGVLVVAFDIAPWVEQSHILHTSPVNYPKFLQLGRGNIRFVLITDEVKGTIEIEAAKIENLPEAITETEGNFFKQRFEHSENLIYIIDEEKLFSKIEEKLTE